MQLMCNTHKSEVYIPDAFGSRKSFTKKPALWNGEGDCDFRLGVILWFHFVIMSVAYFLSVRDTQMIDVSQRLSFLWWQFGCFICSSLTISLAIDRTSRFYLCSPVTPCFLRWQKNRPWSSHSCRVNFVWSKKRETRVHERDEYATYLCTLLHVT